jgi:hypothetical protein
MRTRGIPLAWSIAALAAQSLGLATPALAANSTDVTFAYTGDEQSWVVPAGVTNLHIDLVGAPGGGIPGGGAAGGLGARVQGDLAVSEGATFYVEVGGNGTDGDANGASTSGGFNGGGDGGGSDAAIRGAGSGGGASDLRTITRSDGSSLNSRLIVAAGGGGAGTNGKGGDGGSAGADTLSAFGGGAGTATAGGTGGTGDSSGSNGISGAGGAGALAQGPGGGGGGGLFGGGGGGGSSAGPGAGGGGGSSYTGGATNTTVATDATGTPSVTITYAIGSPGTGTVDAVVTMASSAVCLQLSTTSIDFGTRQFGDIGVAATPGVTVTNCGGISESVLANGTDASGSGPTTWTLNDTGTCAGGTLPTDNYGLTIERQDNMAQTRLGTAGRSIATLSGGAALDNLARIDTPCPGGSGAGVVMSMQIVFLATE